MASEMMQKVGSWAFVLGLIIAVVMGVVGSENMTVWILAVLGLIVGLLNVTGHESQHFLIAAIAFLLSAQGLSLILKVLEPVLMNVVVFVAPATAIVALRALYDIAKEH